MFERACSSVNEPRAAHEQSVQRRPAACGLSPTKRRLRVPKGVALHHEDVPRKERFQLGAIPVTDVRRTLLDCVSSHVSLEFIEADRA
ncbi:MAG: hypothetical protein JWO86_4665 [Myxococcaceae bacterium]|nr:hypothetical protein [Myxococcaceae bacterium]MEA2749225.1 hypothetical protein [Myxococcales bacterium]